MTLVKLVTTLNMLVIYNLISFSSIFSNILMFAVIFITIYFPLSLIRGYWHRKNQLNVEQEALVNNKRDATIWIFLFEYLEGKLTEQEKIV